MKQNKPRALAFAILLMGIASGTALGAERLRGEAPSRSAMYLRLDNDVFAGSDRGYTNGVEIGLTSPTVASFKDPQLSPLLLRLNRRLAWLQPRGFDENNVTLALGQGMFTPEDWRRSEPDPLDRPYAGVLAVGVTYNGRNDYSMRTTTLNVGVVGPSAGAEHTQDFVHGLFGDDEFRGWDHQLHDEPVFRVLHQRMRKWNVIAAAQTADVIVHYGGSVGNLTTFANAGVEFRFGRGLPDNFGTATALATGTNTAPSRMSFYTPQLPIHGFVALDARYVVKDVTLDGNTWRNSASVERKDLVADIGIGLAMHWNGWEMTIARYFRTKEFASQAWDTEFGGIAIRRSFGGR
jgi:lipid A 3-O-deacylase